MGHFYKVFKGQAQFGARGQCAADFPGSAQKRLVEYQDICYVYETIEQDVSQELRASLFEMLGYSVLSAYQMNRKYLYAQANHETGNIMYADMSRNAIEELNKLIDRYNNQLDGKWNQMMSEITPGYTALYQNTPDYVDKPTDAYRLPDNQRHPEFVNKIDLSSIKTEAPFRLLEGIGSDWVALQMGQPLDFEKKGSIEIPIPQNYLRENSDSVTVCVSAIPMWPVAYDRSNCFAVSADTSEHVVCENKFQEWGREWKIQVLENRKDYVITLPLDKNRSEHVITLSIVDPGQIIQKITIK